MMSSTSFRRRLKSVFFRPAPAQSKRREAGSRPRVEGLEERVVPTTPGTWTPLATTGTGPIASTALMQLSDGTVIVQGVTSGNSNSPITTWYKLTPNPSGPFANSYISGSWSAVGSMATGRLFSSSALLTNGDGFIVGGEYSTPFDFTNTVEIFNPLANGGVGAWTTEASVPTLNSQVGNNPPPTAIPQFGDDPIEVLSNGQVLAGYFQNINVSNVTGGISGASNTAPIVITTTSTSGLVNGATVAVRGVTGNTAANGNWVVTGVTGTTFQLVGSNGTASGTFGGGGTWIENIDPTYLYTPPTTNSWTTTFGSPTKLYGDQSDEESWVKLGDGSILSYDIFSSEINGVFQAQRYIPSTNTWVDASAVNPSNPPSLLTSSAQGQELGPAFLLPNGDAFFFGANGNTAYYDPSTGQWSAGPQEPQLPLTVTDNSKGNGIVTNPAGSPMTYLVGTDDPGAMMPNGHILISLSPEGHLNTAGQYDFPNQTYLYEFDPTATTNPFTSVNPSGSLSSPIGENANFLNMIVLPTGQVMMNNEFGTSTASTLVYTPVGSPASSSRPVINTIVSNGDGTYTLTGTQLNGISEGADFGDDLGSSTNYPIVQLTDSGGNIYYARTFNWSSTGVQTGSTPVTTEFTLPAGHTSLSDFTSVIVIASGIPSLPVPALASPNVTPPSNQSSVEGASTSFGLGSFIDPSGSSWTVDVNWGDGTPDTIFSASPGSLGTQSHTYGEEGTYTPTITVTDTTNNLSGSASFQVAVSDPPVVQGPAVAVSPVEGAGFTGPVATFTDPGGAEPDPSDPAPGIASHYSVVSIDWGDGTPLDTTSGGISFGGSPGSTADPFTVSGSHTYGEEGSYTITAVIDHEGVRTTLTGTANVSDPPVLASGVNVSAKEGILFSLPVTTFTDPGGAEPNPFDPTPGIASHYTASIDFGDGTPSSPGVITYSGAPGSVTGVFTVTGSHTFAEEGTFNASVTINHEGVITKVPITAVVRDNYGLLLLDPGGGQSLMVTGQGAVTVNNTGAVVVDSSSPSAIFLTGQAVVTATEADVGIGGGAVIHGQANLNLLEPEFNQEAATPDPIALPLPPMPTTHFSAVHYSGSAALTLSPGTYDGGIAITGKGTVTLLPGVYYMNGGGFSVTGQGAVTGTGVLLVNAPRTSKDVIGITGQGGVNLTAPMGLTGALAAYNGITIMQDPASANPISVVGQGTLTMTGTMYAPEALLKIDGNGNVVVSAFFAGQLSLGGVVAVFDAIVTGNGSLTVNADPAPSFQLAAGRAAGLTADGSGLLASRSALRPGQLLVAVEDSRGAPTPDEQARIDDAIRGLNAALGPFGVDLVEATGAERAAASVRLDIAGTTDFGGVAAGVLGVTENEDAITIVSGWDWYMGADPSGIGPGQYDFETVVAHELAHALGLGEGSDPSSVMYPYLASGVVRRDLSAGDLEVIASSEGEGRLAAPAETVVSGAVPPDSRGQSGGGMADGVTSKADGASAADAVAFAASETAASGAAPTAPASVAGATPPAVLTDGGSEIAGPRVALVRSSSPDPAVMIRTASMSLDDVVAPAVGPDAGPAPAAESSTADGAGGGNAPRDPGGDETGPAGKAPGARPPTSADSPGELPPFSSACDAFFAAGFRAQAGSPVLDASGGAGGSARLLAAAGLALGLGGWRGAPWREEEELRHRPVLK